MITQESAGFILFREKNSERYYLLLQHTNGTHWDFPKGKLEKGETKREAAIRELQEETQIDISQDGHLYPDFETAITYTFTDHNGTLTHKTVYFFLARVTNTDAVISHEHVDSGWFSYHDALAQLTYETARTALTKAHDFLARRDVSF